MSAEPEVPATQQAVARRTPPSNGGQVRRPRPPGPNDAQPRGAARNDQPKNNFMRPRPWWVSFLVVLVLNYLLVQLFLPEQPQPRIDVPYTFFKQQVQTDNVSEVTS